MKMANEEKERFCTFMAALLAPPDDALADDLRQDGLLSWLESFTREWGGDTGGLLQKVSAGDSVSVLQREYARLFFEPQGEKVSLVESTYKPWTVNKKCGMVFGASRGLVMGDSALHMLELYEQLSLEVPEAFRSTPDHLVLQLEFLAMLYRSASREQVGQFIEDHLDWIGELKAEVEKANPHPFYRSAIQLIDSFLQNEARNGEVN
jgi:putative dimethyl sulfoxide reductase chaperone